MEVFSYQCRRKRQVQAAPCSRALSVVLLALIPVLDPSRADLLSLTKTAALSCACNVGFDAYNEINSITPYVLEFPL